MVYTIPAQNTVTVVDASGSGTGRRPTMYCSAPGTPRATETYQRRFEGDEGEGKGLGATFEGAIVTQALYESGGRNAKFRPVVFREENEKFIPAELRRFNRYRVDTPEGYEKLLRWLHEAPSIVAPPVHPKPDLPPELAPELFPSKPAKPRDPQ